MKTRKRYVRAGAACLAALLTVQGMTLPVAAGEEVKVRSNSQTQMSSDPEAVYVSNYGKSTDQRTINFDSNWKFNLGDVENAQTANFDDSKWRQVSLPHDYSIEQDYSKSMEAESGYLPGGTGWYRKSFTIDKAAEGKEIRVDFSGVYMNASVWVNGEKLGTHPYGYTPFSFDITDYVKYGEENTIAVKVENKTPSSRWYSGSGIYRSVNLTMTEKVHVDLEGTQITTENLKAEQGGTVNMDVRTQVVNDSEDEQAVTLTHTVFPKGADESAAIGTVTTEAKTVASGESDEIEITTVNTDNNPAIRNQYHLKGKYDAKVSIIFYNNGTLFLQGAVTAFYIELITEIMETISSVPTEVMEDFLAIQPLVGCVIEKDLNKHFTKTENIEGSILEDFLKTSIALANSGVVVDDYGCYTFGIMKALDGLISKRLLEDAPDFKDYGTYFERGKDGNYHFLENVGTYNGNPSLKRALEKAYDFYNKNRHTTFHIDRRNLETSRTLYYDEAVNIIKDGLVIINDLCTNW